MSTIVFQDNFTGTDGTALTAHTPDTGASWLAASGDTSPVLSSAGRARTSATGAADYVFAEPASALASHDYTVSVNAHWMGTGGAGGGRITLASHAAGVIGSGNAIPGTGYAIRLGADSGTVDFYRNGLTFGTPPASGFGVPTAGDEFVLEIDTATNAGNCDLKPYIQRVADSKYLASDGTWSATRVTFLAEGTVTDTSPLAFGEGALAFFEYAGNAVGWHGDNFTVTDLSAGGGPSPGTLTSTSNAYNATGWTWTAATGGVGAITAQLQRSAHGAGTYSNVAGATSSPATDSTVAASTAYDYRVAYTDTTPTTAYSNVVTVTTPAGPAPLAFATPIAVCTATGFTVYADGTNGSTAASGGTAPYSYQWYASATSDFTPGGGNLLAAATGQNYTPGSATTTLTFYKQIVTDSEGTPATATSVEAPARKLDADINCLVIGDSRNYNPPGGGGSNPPGIMNLLLPVLSQNGQVKLHNVTTVNAAASGSKTADWLTTAAAFPGTTPSTGGLNLWNYALGLVSTAAVTPTHILIALGVNDAITGVSTVTLQSNLNSIIAACNAQWPGVPVLLSYMSYGRPAGSYGHNVNAVMQQYNGIVDGMVNGTSIFAGDKASWQASAVFQNWRNGNDIHPYLGDMMAMAQIEPIAQQMYPAAAGGGLLLNPGMTGRMGG